MRVVFFGTPAFAVPTLQRLVHDSQFAVELVVSQPDRPSGRGRRIEASPVILAARELGLPTYQPASLREARARAPLEDVAADVFVVAAYGLIFGAKTLAIPRLGCVNVHASLLPRYRGASPIAAAIWAGDDTTGVTLMRMETGLDTGPMIATRQIPILASDTTGSLTERLAALGAELAVESLPRYALGELVPAPQPATAASLTRPLTKRDGWLEWSLAAYQLERSVRAFWPWPRAWTTLGTQVLQVHQAAVVPLTAPLSPGTILSTRSELVVACGQGALRLTLVQATGGKPVTDSAFLAGHHQLPERVGVEGDPGRQPPLVAQDE